MRRWTILAIAILMALATACGGQTLSDEQLSDLVRAEVERQLAAMDSSSGPPGPGVPEIALSQVIQMAHSGQIERIEVNGDKLTVRSRDGEVFTSRKETGASVVEILERSGVDPAATSNIQIIVK